jgi:hypothetical protein
MEMTMNQSAPKDRAPPSRHTPGPWRISDCQLGNKLLIEHGNDETKSPIIGSVYGDAGRLPQEANAALIASAPMLLEVLKIARVQLGDYQDGQGAAQLHAINIIDKAIAAAEAA